MSLIEGIGDDLLCAVGFLVFLGIVSLAWFSTRVNHIPLPNTLFIIERRTRRRNGTSEIHRVLVDRSNVSAFQKRRKRNVPVPRQLPVMKQHLHHQHSQSDRIPPLSTNRTSSQSWKTIHNCHNEFSFIDRAKSTRPMPNKRPLQRL